MIWVDVFLKSSLKLCCLKEFSFGFFKMQAIACHEVVVDYHKVAADGDATGF